MLVFYFNTEPRLKWNKIILVAKRILFHFRRGSMLNYFKEFQTPAAAIGHHAKIILFHFRRDSMLK